MKEQLRKLVYEKAAVRVGPITDVYIDQIELELKRIEELKLENDFLCLSIFVSVCYDIKVCIQLDTERLGNSYVAYCLGLSEIDPIEHDLPLMLNNMFRFMNITIPSGSLGRIAEEFYRTTGKKTFKVAYEREDNDENDLEEDRKITYNGKKYFLGDDDYLITNSNDFELISLNDVDYIVIPTVPSEDQKLDIFTYSILESDELGMLQTLHDKTKSVKAIPWGYDYDSTEIYGLIKNGKLENILPDSFIKYWMPRFPLHNLNDLCIVLAYDNLRNDDFINDYFNLLSEWSYQKLSSDTKIHQLFDKTNGTLIYKETIIQLISYILGVSLEEGEEFMLDYEDKYRKNPFHDSREIFERFIKAGLKNTTGTKSTIWNATFAILDSIPYSHWQGKLLVKAQIVYQLSYYKVYHSKLFDSIYGNSQGKIPHDSATEK